MQVWNIALKQGIIREAPEVSRLTVKMIAGSDEGSDTDSFADL